MKKEQDFQKLKKIAMLLSEAFMTLDDIEEKDEIFNSDKAIEVISKYPSINASLDDLLYDLVNYFWELLIINKKR